MTQQQWQSEVKQAQEIVDQWNRRFWTVVQQEGYTPYAQSILDHGCEVQERLQRLLDMAK